MWDKLSQRMKSFQYDPSLRFRAWLRISSRTRSRICSNESAAAGRLQHRHGTGPGVAADRRPFGRRRRTGGRAGERARSPRHPVGCSGTRSPAQRRPHLAGLRATALQDVDASRVAQELGMGVASVYQAKTRMLKRIREEVDRPDNFSSAP